MPDFQYARIAAALRPRVTCRDYPGGRLPSERDLMTEFGVQRDTVRRALGILEQEGLIFRDATRGRFITPPRDAAPPNGAVLMAVRRMEFSPSSTAVQRGLASVLSDAGQSVVWFDTLRHGGGTEITVPPPEVLCARGVAAVALWPELPADLTRLRALRAALPLVLLDRRVPGFEADFVGFDDVAGGRTVTEHLLRQGHRRIGFVSAEPLAATVQARVRGWSAALAAAGITARPEWVLHPEGGIKTLPLERLRQYLAGGADPLTAVVCANDTVAAELIHFLRGRGRRVPNDLAVTGFGNVTPALLDALGLTTMSQPFEQMGRLAGETLLARLNGRHDDPRDVELGLELVVRESCGSARPRDGT